MGMLFPAKKLMRYPTAPMIAVTPMICVAENFFIRRGMTGKILIAVDILFSLLAVWFAYVLFRDFKPSRRKLAKLEQKQVKKASKQQEMG